MEKILKKGVGITLVITLLIGITPIIDASDNAGSLTNASVSIGDSSPGATTDYTFTFETNEEIPSGGEIRLEFPSSSHWVQNISGDEITCPDGYEFDDVRTTSQYAICGDAQEDIEPGEYTIEVEDVEHPGGGTDGQAETYTIDITTESENGEDEGSIVERAQVMVALIEPVTVRATVDASLSFDVSGVDDGDVNGTDITIDDTSATRIPFGTLETDIPAVAAQELSVSTNASEGFTVTVFQDGNLVSAADDEISAFQNDDPVSPGEGLIGWESPEATLDEEHTYGHFGFTTADHQVAESCLDDPDDDGTWFYDGGALWAGFDGDQPEEVMCHVGPSDGSTEHKGTTRVGYKVEISDLQPAGEYRNTLTYIATPTF